jgi:hypothetical protein
VVPVFQSAFIVGAILVGATYFKEFNNFSTLQMIFFPMGITIVIFGVMLLSSRKMSSSSSAHTSEKVEVSEMLFIRRKRADITPGVVRLFRDLTGTLGGRGRDHVATTNKWQRGQEIPEKDAAKMKNSNDMALETLDELDEIDEMNLTVPIKKGAESGDGSGSSDMTSKYAVKG